MFYLCLYLITQKTTQKVTSNPDWTMQSSPSSLWSVAFNQGLKRGDKESQQSKAQSQTPRTRMLLFTTSRTLQLHSANYTLGAIQALYKNSLWYTWLCLNPVLAMDTHTHSLQGKWGSQAYEQMAQDFHAGQGQRDLSIKWKIAVTKIHSRA